MYVGWIKLHRNLSEHWVWKDKPFTKGQAWIDILLECNHSDVKFNQKGMLLVCRRGESLNSLDTWAWRWGWNKSRVRRFLKLLQNDNMVELKSETITTRLTVCNYDKWQDVRHGDETEMKRKRHGDETQMTPNKNNKKDNNEKKVKKFIPPTLDEFKNYFKENGYTEEAAEKAWGYYDVADWHDSKGTKIKNWKQKCRGVWFREENKISDKPQERKPWDDVIVL